MSQYTTEEAIEISLFQDKLNNTLSKIDSRIEDSIGDQLFRASLNLSWCFTFGTKEQTLQMLTKAKELLALTV